MDPAILSEILKLGSSGIIIVGLIYALKAIRAEHAERERTWKALLDAKDNDREALQKENILALRDQIRVNLETGGVLRDIAGDVHEVKEAVFSLRPAKGGG